MSRSFDAYISPIFAILLFSWGVASYVSFLAQVSYHIITLLLITSIFLILLVMALTSYFICVHAQHSVPEMFEIPDAILDRVEQEIKVEEKNAILMELINIRRLPVLTAGNFMKEVKYCSICKVLKPDRTHHCSQCNSCIPKMDHHCIWIGNCIGFRNYKPFILFLFYSILLLILYFATVPQFILSTWKTNSEQFNLALFCLIGFSTLIPLLSLLCLHLYFIFKNKSTMESFQTPWFMKKELNTDKFDLGCYRNMCETMGDSIWKWFLPWSPGRGNGYIFPIKFKGNIYTNFADTLFGETKMPSDQLNSGIYSIQRMEKPIDLKMVLVE